jgi:hypothetical protein
MQPDLLQRIAAPLRALLERRLLTLAPAGSAEALASLLDLGGLAVLAIVLAAACRTLASRTTAPSPPARTLGGGIPAAAGVAALGLLVWILRHPSTQFDLIFTRWDHLALCALVGLAAAAAPPTWRKLGLAGLSIAFLLQYCGVQAVALVGAIGLLGFALLRTSLVARPWALALAEGGLIAGAYGYALWVRRGSVWAASPLQGLLAFAALRHISFVIEAVKTPRRLHDYAAFMTFYPGVAGIFGAPEVYAEFSRRNLARPGAVDHGRAARRVALGALQAWVALRIPVSADTVLSSPGPALAWASAAVFFIRTALGVMGGWAMIDGAALFLGVQLRANFRGLLTCQNPSELWWAWRGTLTNWLVQHVYGPLGGRRHLVRNLLAAFAVSFLWHALGVPFLTADFHLVQVTPVALWAGINAAAVLLHGLLSRTGPGTAPPGWSGRAMRIVLMWWLGAMTPLLLSFQGDAVARFPALLRALLGASTG